MLKAYKYRIYPNKEQKSQIEQHFGACRLVWNLALDVKIQAYQSNRVQVSRYTLQTQLLDLKDYCPWLCDVTAQSMQAVLLKLDNAFRSFYKGYGFPKFKSKNGIQSFQYPQNVKIQGDCIRLPKLGLVRIAQSRQFDGIIKTVTISKTGTNKYFASILVQNEQDLPNKPLVASETTIGIDLGIKDFAITSTGLKIENPKYLKNNIQRIKCLQRRVGRKKKGSNNRKKAIKQLAIQHEKVANMRKDFLHKITTKLVCDSQASTFCVENLNISGMVKNRKLSQSISDAGWGEFIRQMKYKCEWYGKNLIEIGRFEPSSKTCSHCGTVNETLTLADREWACASCLTIHDRDINAAINIKNFGLKKHSGAGCPGEPVESLRLRKAKKQGNDANPIKSNLKQK